ncbi:fibronectin type III domain-containing protein [Treponema brennaborense]|uniref:Pectate disaccharide-lyase n=1 Tax=Treponema brennaborense (strain DSM 12168 / CIP 105900 / DD5/3) TaxID=906968 RepID=F4LKL6_TREBD|nr:fibronectin type III domain-containing protein [Treponema brennaborense]AEE17572.1 Pectate disaccharide-lyase [Treponema brennaborense DSM 12168]
MKRTASLFKRLCVWYCAAVVFFPLFAADRKPWDQTAVPVITAAQTLPDAPGTVELTCMLETSTDGADKGLAEMLDQSLNVVDSKPIGKTRRDEKKITFTPPKSGTYSFRVTALRTGEKEGLVSESVTVRFTLPLEKPAVQLLNAGGGALELSWSAVPEASSYVVRYTDVRTGTAAEKTAGSTTHAQLTGLTAGSTYAVSVAAVRGAGSASADVAYSDPIDKLIKNEREREWQFAWFGQSSSKDRNTMRMIDGNNLTFELNSCTFDPATQMIKDKGGKFTAFHDGISYYYTVIDPDTENFELTATFTVDYINITADGQEGFGILAMDSIGQNGVNAVNHYTNSAGVIATKFEKTINGVKKTSKDTLGARFVSGITGDVIALGDSGIAQYGKSVSDAYSYDQSDLVRAGDTYRVTLKKTNTGYHAIFKRTIASEDTIEEYIMYGPEKLRQLDADHVYVGFAAARGCNVTVSDVSMKITDPAADPAAQEEPPELIPLTVKVDSPSTYHTSKYPFVFTSNADGLLTVTDKNGKTPVKNAKVKALIDYKKTIKVPAGLNDYQITFTPDPDFRPGEKQAIAQYNAELKTYEQDYKSVSIVHTVINKSYGRAELYAAPDGSAFGDGSPENPLDIQSALNYVKPGQTVVLSGGTYYPTRGIMIERGNSGVKKSAKNITRKTLRSADGTRAILDFTSAGAGFQLWGDCWLIEGIDIRNTPGNVKGLQVAGSDNVVRRVNTYSCGDTGLQISGVSSETFPKWPARNLIENCTSYGNIDPAANNADGFAAKLTCADGNVFRGCIAYGNIDDGWDLFAKIESGPIGAVLIENCIAYKNGSLPDGSGNGDGNGFKLGGDGIAVPHVLRNSISFGNGTSGITSNSDPAIKLENVTSYGNKGANINLYGKGKETERQFAVSNSISMEGMSADEYKEMPSLAAPGNYFWNGAQSLNSEGRQLTPDVFVSTDTDIVPVRKADGSIDMKGLLELTDAAPAGVGARF